MREFPPPPNKSYHFGQYPWLYLQQLYLFMSDRTASNIQLSNFIQHFYPSHCTYLNNSTYTPLTGFSRSHYSAESSQSRSQTQQLTPNQQRKEQAKLRQKNNLNQDIQNSSHLIQPQLVIKQNKDQNQSQWDKKIRERILINQQIQLIKLKIQKNSQGQEKFKQDDHLAESIKLQRELKQKQSSQDFQKQAGLNEEKITKKQENGNQTKSMTVPPDFYQQQSYPIREKSNAESLMSQMENRNQTLSRQIFNHSQSPFRGKLQKIGSYLLRLRWQCSWIQQKLQSNNTYRQISEKVRNEYIFPLTKVYQSLPQAVTDLKYELTKDYPIRKRILVVTTASIIFGLASTRAPANFTLGNILKRTVFANAIGTFFLVPEYLYFLSSTGRVQSKVQVQVRGQS